MKKKKGIGSQLHAIRQQLYNSVGQAQLADYVIYASKDTIENIIYTFPSFTVADRFLPESLIGDVEGTISGMTVKRDDSLANGFVEIRGNGDVYTITTQ